MSARRMHSILAILIIMVIAGFAAICSLDKASAQVVPSASEEAAKEIKAQAQSGDSGSSENDDSGSTKSKNKKSGSSNSNGGSNDSNSKKNSSGKKSSDSSSGSNTESENSESDDDVLEENAFSTPGNASLGDVINDSDEKDFYTIRTDNDNVYYLVIDHAGNMDNVYLLSNIDEDDLQDFLESGDSNGMVILPENNVEKTHEKTPDDADEPEEKEAKPEKNKTTGIISLAILILAAIGGGIAFMKYRRGNEEPEEYETENIEEDEFPTVNEDEEFLEQD